jgi:sugar phosphate isomerase/epimerase
MDSCIFCWFGYKYPFGELIQLIKEAGFQSVMIWWGEREDDSVPKERKPDIVRKAGLKLLNAHLPFTMVDALWKDTLDGEEMFEIYSSYIDDCKIHEIPTAIMHTTNRDAPHPNKIGLTRFRKLIEKAEKNGVNIAIENVFMPEYMDYVFNNIESERLKFCYDSGHANCFTPEIDMLAKYGDKLAALHLHDNDGSGDQHLLPFNGNINWEQIMAQLKRFKFDGPLALEVFARENDGTTAPQYLSEAMKRVQKLKGFCDLTLL